MLRNLARLDISGPLPLLLGFVSVPLWAQTPPLILNVQAGVLAPFGEMKSRSLDYAGSPSGNRRDAFSNGFSLQASLWPAGNQRIRGRGSLGICGLNGTSSGPQTLDLQYLAYGLSAGFQSSLGIQPSGQGLYAFSELRFDWEFYHAKSPGSSWTSFGAGSRRCLRMGLGLGLGWIAPGSGLTLEAEVRTSLTGPISSNPDSQDVHVFWSSLPPDRYLRLSAGWTWSPSK